MSLLLNITQIEDDPLMDINPEEVINEFESIDMNWYWIFTDITKFIIGLALVSGDLFMIITICRNKKLKTKTNSYILNYFIFNLLYLCSPIFWILFELIPLRSLFGSLIFCTLYYLEGCFMSFCHLFSGGLALDWLFMVHNPALGQRFQKQYNYSIYFTYFIGLIYTIIVCSNCFYLSMRTFTLDIVYSSILIFIIVCNYYKSKNKTLVDNKKSFSLTISTIMIVSWIPLHIYDLLIKWTREHTILEFILTYTLFIPDWLSFACPILVIFMLGKLNKHYRMAYDRAFKKNVRDYECDEESLEESEETKNAENVAAYANITTI